MTILGLYIINDNSSRGNPLEFNFPGIAAEWEILSADVKAVDEDLYSVSLRGSFPPSLA